MRQLRVTVAGLMAIVLILAIGMVALRAQSALLTSAVFTIAVVLFSASIVGAMATRGPARISWLGMAVFGWVYIVLVFAPWSAEAIGPPPLVTTPLLDYAQDYILSDGTTPYVYSFTFSQHINQGQGLRGRVTPGAVAPPGGYKHVDLALYQQAGHSLGAILFGLLGALIGRFFAARYGRPESD